MFGSKGMLVAILAATLGVPWLYSSWPSVRAWLSSAATATQGQAASPAIPATGVATPATTGVKPVTVPTGPTVRDFGEVFRFDVTTAWVLGRWPRVSAGLGELDLQGYRVALVTGSSVEDLAGSLTYYFNPQQKVQRIFFQGTTGDARKLVAFLSRQYKFVRNITDDPSLYLYEVKWNGKPVSELRITTARIIRADNPRARFEVRLVLERPHE
jgi:hypothetical protein